VNNHLSS